MIAAIERALGHFWCQALARIFVWWPPLFVPRPAVSGAESRSAEPGLSDVLAPYVGINDDFMGIIVAVHQGGIGVTTLDRAVSEAGRDPAPFRARVLLTDGGVYDNHGLEPIVKRYVTLLVSDGGAPFTRTLDIATDPIRELQQVFNVTDNQVRSLRRRDLIRRYQASAQLQPDQVDQDARFGTYWGIDTDPSKVVPAGAPPCTADVAHSLAGMATRLSDLRDAELSRL